MRLPVAAAVLAAAACCWAPTAVAAPRPLALRRVSLDLPAPPAALIPGDLDGDGRTDLTVVLAYTSWGSISSDRVEDAVMVTEVVPALFDRREVRVFLAKPDGGYDAGTPPLELPSDVVAIARGTPRMPVLAVTSEGVSALRLATDGGGRRPVLRPVVREKPLLAGSESFLPSLDLLGDADGDGIPDLLLPTEDGLAIYRGTKDGFESEAASRVPWPGQEFGGRSRSVPQPTILDVDGDGISDLVVEDASGPRRSYQVLRGLGGARFAPPRPVPLRCILEDGPSAAGPGVKDAAPPRPRFVDYFGDVDGDGRPEVVTRQPVDTGQSDLKQTKRPRSIYRFHHVRPDLSVESAPYMTLEADGYATTGDFDAADFRDLDHDGKLDFVAVTLDFSAFQILRALTTKKIGIDLEFRTWCSASDGRLHEVQGQVLVEKLRFDLNRLELGRLAQFKGDFDGDGRVDFLRLGGGKEIAIHRGQAGCRYAEKPDLVIPLDEEPDDVLLVRVDDLDADGRSDVAITRPLDPGDEQVTSRARLDLLLSGGAP